MENTEGADEPCVDLVALHEKSRARQFAGKCRSTKRQLLVGCVLMCASLCLAASIVSTAPLSCIAVPTLFAVFLSGALFAIAVAMMSVALIGGSFLQRVVGAASPLDYFAPSGVHTRWPTSASRGDIALVGAGSGSVNQLTLEAFSALLAADVVICDRLLPAQLHAAIPLSAVLYVADKIPGKADAAQDELNAWGIAALRRGQRVVRLKVGDPFLFGRGGEEVLFYRGHGFEPRVLPGLATALAAPVIAGLPLTHRGVANQVLITTGRDKGGALPALPRYDAKRTLVLLMAVGRLPTLAADLGALGFPADTPTAVIERSTHPDERVTRAPLARIADVAESVGVRSPAVIVVGHCLDVLGSMRVES